MTAQHPSRTWKGCAQCKAHKIKGDAERKYPWRVARQLGQKRRWKVEERER